MKQAELQHHPEKMWLRPETVKVMLNIHGACPATTLHQHGLQMVSDASGCLCGMLSGNAPSACRCKSWCMLGGGASASNSAHYVIANEAVILVSVCSADISLTIRDVQVCTATLSTRSSRRRTLGASGTTTTAFTTRRTGRWTIAWTGGWRRCMRFATARAADRQAAVAAAGMSSSRATSTSC